MVKRLIRRSRMPLCLIAIAFLLAHLVLPRDHLVMALNGAVAGVIAAVVMIYRRLLLHALRGEPLSPGVAAFSVSILLLWLYVYLTVINSVLVRLIFHLEVPTGEITIWTRLVAILAAFFQVTAPATRPDFPFCPDTRLLVKALVLGGAVALGVYIAQAGAP